jgi:amino-acid N-acetyltransferase
MRETRAMQQPEPNFTEKSFYLAEFRGRSIAIALPEADLTDLTPLRSVIADLAANETRVVLLSPHRALLEKLAGDAVQSSAEARWIGPLWRRLRRGLVAGLELPEADFLAQSRETVLRLRLAKLVWLDSDGGLQREDGGRLSVLDLAALDSLLTAVGAGERSLPAERLALLREVRQMIAGGLPAVNLCSPAGLGDELFTYAGSGTFLTAERYAEVRRLALDEFDAADHLIARGVEEGYLVRRGDEELEALLENAFGAFVEGRYLAGIGALLPHREDRAGEIASLYTLTRYLGEGVGVHLVRFALAWATREGYDYVFACTTLERVERFFERSGFRRVEPGCIPASKWQGYSAARRPLLRCMRLDLR